MAELQRVDLLLPKTLLRRIKKAAQERGSTFSSMVRESLQLRFPHGAAHASRLAAVKRLKAMSLPIGSWKQMESEIHRGRMA